MKYFQTIFPPRRSGHGKSLDEARHFFPQSEAHKQQHGPEWTRKSPTDNDLNEILTEIFSDCVDLDAQIPCEDSHSGSLRPVQPAVHDEQQPAEDGDLP